MGQDEDTRELSLDEAVALANLLQRNERLDEADALYRAVLEKAPHHVDALHFAGVLASRLGHHDDAVALIEQSLALAPDRADCYNNLGIVLQSAGRLDAAGWLGPTPGLRPACELARTVPRSSVQPHPPAALHLAATG